MKLANITVVFAIVLAACGGAESAGSTTAATTEPVLDAPTTTTSVVAVADDLTDDRSDAIIVGSIDDMPAVCKETFVAMLKTIEPLIADIDFAAATIAEFGESMEAIEPQMTAFGEEMTANGCDDYDLEGSDDEAWAQMLALVEEEAPGASPFFSGMSDLVSSFEEPIAGGTGDCDGDLAALRALAEGGKTMEDMTLAEVAEIGNLMTAISEDCPVDELANLLDDPALAGLLGG